MNCCPMMSCFSDALASASTASPACASAYYDPLPRSRRRRYPSCEVIAGDVQQARALGRHEGGTSMPEGVGAH